MKNKWIFLYSISTSKRSIKISSYKLSRPMISEKNAMSSQSVMNSLVQKGGSLKSLADGFEIVTNSRDVQRTILTPPLK